MPTIPVPSDFREVAPRHTVKELLQIYGHDGAVIRRWSAETGAYASNARHAYRAHAKSRRAKQIDCCLNCPYSECIGKRCDLLKSL